MENQKVWYITGASKGLGLALVKKLLKEGYRVAATSRNLEQLVASIGPANENFLPLKVNLADEQSVKDSIDQTFQFFKSIDVIVNNAGYGIGGSIEELTDTEVRDSFDINVFGTMNVVRHVMPYLREQQSGHIINISSIAGFAPATGWSVYAGTKFAVVGLSEVLAEDVKGFGVKVTVVLPGAFRTSFLTGESLVYAEHRLEAYKDVAASHAKYDKLNGTQIGDPEKAADLFIGLAQMENPPVRLFIGSDAHQRALNKLETLDKEMTQLASITLSTDY